MSNYPDNIRQFDNDPRSPFYDDRYERLLTELIEKHEEEIALATRDADHHFYSILELLQDSEGFNDMVSIMYLALSKSCYTNELEEAERKYSVTVLDTQSEY